MEVTFYRQQSGGSEKVEVGEFHAKLAECRLVMGRLVVKVTYNASILFSCHLHQNMLKKKTRLFAAAASLFLQQKMLSTY